MTRCGACRSENVGMSSVIAVRNRDTVSPRVPTQGYIRVGLGGPKPRARAVGDGQQVSIPAPPMVRLMQEG